MIVIGAGGFAKQLLPSLQRKEMLKNCVFYDDVTLGHGGFIHQNFNVIRSESELSSIIKLEQNQFILAIGNPLTRRHLSQKIESMGGELISYIDPKCSISEFDVKLENGIVILEDVIIESGVQIGIGCLINLRTIITHDCVIGDFCELSPGSVLLGACQIGDNTFIGASAVVLPKVKVGKNCIIGAGSVVNKDIPDHGRYAGVPARALDL
jgi:sugar O-acyltransferase (sialic acid O-acetyltransferase NeuD family)